MKRLIALVLSVAVCVSLSGCKGADAGVDTQDMGTLTLSRYSMSAPKGLVDSLKSYDTLFSSWYGARSSEVGASELYSDWLSYIEPTPVYYIGENGDLFLRTSNILLLTKSEVGAEEKLSNAWGDLPTMYFEKAGDLKTSDSGVQCIKVQLKTKETVLTNKVSYTGYLARQGTDVLFYGCKSGSGLDSYISTGINTWSVTDNKWSATPLDDNGVYTLNQLSFNILNEIATAPALSLSSDFNPADYALEDYTTSTNITYSLPSNLYSDAIDYDLACYTCRRFDEFVCDITNKYHTQLQKAVESKGTLEDKVVLNKWLRDKEGWLVERDSLFSSTYDKGVYSTVFLGELSVSDSLCSATNKLVFPRNKLENIKEDFKKYWLSASYLADVSESSLNSAYDFYFDTLLSPFVSSVPAGTSYGQLGEYLDTYTFDVLGMPRYRDLTEEYRAYLSDKRFIFVTSSDVPVCNAIDNAFTKPDTRITKYLDFDVLLNGMVSEANKVLTSNCEIYSPFRCGWKITDSVNYSIESNWALRYFRGASSSISKQVEGTLEPVSFSLSNQSRSVVNALIKTTYDVTIVLHNRITDKDVAYTGKLAVASQQDKSCLIYWDVYSDKDKVPVDLLEYEMSSIRVGTSNEVRNID